MNHEEKQESGEVFTNEISPFELKLGAVRPAEIPEHIRTRIQFEMGRNQGRREAFRAASVYASAACLFVWAATTWLLPTKTSVSSGAITQVNSNNLSSKSIEHVQNPSWTMDEIQKIAQLEAVVLQAGKINRRSDGEGLNSSGDATKTPAISAEYWNRHRWIQELMAESAGVPG